MNTDSNANDGSQEQTAPVAAPVATPVAQTAATDDIVTKMAAAFETEVSAAAANGDQMRSLVDRISSIGTAELRRASSVSNSMLERPLRSLKGGTGDNVSGNIVKLRGYVDRLNPAGKDLLSPKRILGIIPFGSKVQDYINSYQSSKKNIDEIVESLYVGRDDLLRDVASIEVEEKQLRDLNETLKTYSAAADELDARLTAALPQIEAESPDKAKVVKEEMLFALRQKRQDLATQIAVNIQSLATMDVIRKNNKNLVSAVQRTTDTTMQAMRTALATAAALDTQKRVISQIRAVNKTTEQLIVANSQMLKDNSAQIAEDASSSAISVEALETSFKNVIEAMDTVDNYKLQAVDQLQESITKVRALADKSEAQLSDRRSALVSDTLASLPSGQAGSTEQKKSLSF